MKRTTIICLVLMALGIAASAEDASAKKVRLPINYGESGWGYVDGTGAPASAARYIGAGPFSEGLAAIEDSRHLWGFIDMNERVVVQPQFSEAGPFSEGFAAVRVGERGDWGYIDTTGQLVIPARYKGAEPFHERYARVYTGTEIRLVNTIARELAVPSPWRVFAGFSEDLAVLMAEGKAGFIDLSGNITTVSGCTYAEGFSGGLAVVKVGSKYGYIDKKGKLAIEAAYDLCRSFHENRAAVQLNGKWGFIDPQNKPVIKAEYDSAGDFSQGLAPVGQGGTELGSAAAWRYIDIDGKTIIPPAYASAGPFVDGFARVSADEMQGMDFYIDKQGMPLAKLPFLAGDVRADFSGAENDFHLSNIKGWKTEKGSYSYASDDANFHAIRSTRLASNDFYAEVKVLSVAGKKSLVGLGFKMNAAMNDYYVFGLREDGGCDVQYKGKDKKWETVATGVIGAPKGVTTLQVVSQGDRVDCYLNGAKAISFRDTRVGELYRYVGLFVDRATAASFDDLAVRAIRQDESLAGLDFVPAPEAAYNFLDVHVNMFPKSSLRVFTPRNGLGELYLEFLGMGIGAYQMEAMYGEYSELEFKFHGQPLSKDLGELLLRFPKKMPTDDSGKIKPLDERAFYLPQLATYGSMNAEQLAAARASSPEATGAIDLAVFLRDWKSFSLEMVKKRADIDRSRWVAFGDPAGIAVGVIDLGGIIATLWGLIDWGISGSFGQRQSWEVWGGLGAMAAANLLYIPYGFLIAQPLARMDVERKTAEMIKEMDAKFNTLAAAMRATYPEDVFDGKPFGVGTE